MKTFDGLMALISTGLMVYAGGTAAVFAFILAIFFVIAWCEGHDD